MFRIRLLHAALALAGVGASLPASAAKPDPGQPLLDSFIEDFVYARDRVDAEIGNGVMITCDHEPCTLRVDLDDDGERDLVVQVVESSGLPGLAVLMTHGPALLAGAGAGPAMVDSLLADLTSRTAAVPWRAVTVAELVKAPPGVTTAVLLSDVLVVVDGGGGLAYHPGAELRSTP